MTLVVDEIQTARRIAFVHREISVSPGPLTLAYPHWIRGEQGPVGPIQQFADLRIHGRNEMLPWTWDPDDVFIFHVEVPSNTDRIAVGLRDPARQHDFGPPTSAGVKHRRAQPRAIDKQNLIVDPSVVRH